MDRRSPRGQRLSLLLVALGALLGVSAGLAVLLGAPAETLRLPGAMSGLSACLRLDPLAAFFLLPVHVLGAAGSLFGLRYWRQEEHPLDGCRLRFFYGLLIAAMAGVMLAADGITFLIAWEVMALSAFFLVATEDEQPAVRQAGWLYLVATHVGTLALFALFALLWSLTGSPELRPLPNAALGPGATSGVLLLAFLGFGLKAGIVPFHFWLPDAHASAPSHVSALLSGVLLKVAVYGLLRTLSLLPPPPPGWGIAVLLLGSASALYGVAFALGQHDLKRLLAYHSIENVGIIVMGLGLALLGTSAHQPVWAALGIGGCLLHVWNHGLFKALLFFGAGSVLHGTGTRDIEQLGGLGRSMRGTALLFGLGALAICGLPPLNGFVSELLIYVGLFRVAGDAVPGPWAAAALVAPVLAMVGALAVACFVKAWGSVFLGHARSAAAAGAHESPPSMRIAMGFLAAACIAIGILPVLALPPLERVAASWLRFAAVPRLSTLLPWGPLMLGNAALLAGVTGAAVLVRAHLARRPPATGLTWDCGYAAPNARMAYTASSFAEMLVRLFGWLLRPRFRGGVGRDLFPPPGAFESRVSDAVLESWLVPGWRAVRRTLGPLRTLQQGRVQRYLVYMLITLCLLLLQVVPVGDLLRRLLGW
jgi:hydrogenase-4 component B